MENGTDALLMAFAIFIFILALSVSLTTLTKAKSTADIVLFYSDRENFQPMMKYDKENYKDGGRNVDIDTVIATIVRCAKEKFTVKVIDGTNEKDVYIFEYDVQTETQIKSKINDFIEKHKGNSYREKVVEVTTSGTTIFGEDEEGIKDGIQLEQNVGKKIYITYEKIS